GLGHALSSSRIQWLAAEPYAKVFVDVAASGPRVIELAATLADGVTFGVGADPARLRWAIDIAHRARDKAGQDPDAVRLGGYVNVVVHDRPEIARRLGEGGLTVFTRFSGMHGKVEGPASAELKGAVEGILKAYDMDS